MRFNPHKCEKRKSSLHAAYFIHGQVMNQTDSFKYLGLNIHQSLSWDHRIDRVTMRANSTLAFLGRNIRRCQSTPRPSATTRWLDQPWSMRPLYGALVKRIALTRLRQFSVVPQDSPLKITSAQAV